MRRLTLPGGWRQSRRGRVLAVIGMLHDKDIAGTLACLEPVVDSWYCAPLEGHAVRRQNS
jgi:folylpolyglutamate synthase/dihydropteroate synthase